MILAEDIKTSEEKPFERQISLAAEGKSLTTPLLLKLVGITAVRIALPSAVHVQRVVRP